LFAQGGLGILSLEAQNVCVLNKWIYKFINQTLFDKNLASKKCLKKSIGHVQWKLENRHLSLFSFNLNGNEEVPK
jgi:hypothetical protein